MPRTLARSLLVLSLLGLPGEGRAAAPAGQPVIHPYWESYTRADGLPDDKVMAVAVDGPRVWIGTDHGAAVLEDGAFRVFHRQDGLAHDAVLSVAVDPVSGDVWFGTGGGLSRYSAGRWTTFTQLTSGLPNDVIFGVAVENQNVWVATTAGTGRYRVRDHGWDVYTPANSPQHEPWGYFVDYADGLVWAALWGGGVLEFDVAKQTWKSYLDPDGEMEIDLFRDDGIVHVITTGVSYREGLLWASTYFGLSRYDGHQWRSFAETDTGIASDFINFVKARGKVVYICADKGLSALDGASPVDRTVTYTPVHGPLEGHRGWEARIYERGQLVGRQPLAAGLAHNFVWAVDFQGDDLWVATSRGLSRGSLRPLPPRPARATGPEVPRPGEATRPAPPPAPAVRHAPSPGGAARPTPPRPGGR